MGYRQALTRNLIVRALGVILPACSASLLFCVLARAIGGLYLYGHRHHCAAEGKSLSHQVSFNMIAAMTALYGVGQIAGPLIAGALYQIAASFNGALCCGAGADCRRAGLYRTPGLANRHALQQLAPLAQGGAFKPLRQISWVVASHSGSLRQFSGSVIFDSTLCGSRQA